MPISHPTTLVRRVTWRDPVGVLPRADYTGELRSAIESFTPRFS